MTTRRAHPTPGPLHVGIWRGPGILALIGDEWRHYPPGLAAEEARERGAMIVGTDQPMLGICRVLPDPEDLLD